MAELDKQPSDADSYHDAFDDELEQSWKLPEKDILFLAQKIGHEWQTLGILLGYESATLNHLEEVYPKQPMWRNFILLQQWCNVASRLHLNVKKYLAHLLFQNNHTHLADTLCTDYKDVKVPEDIFFHVQRISFDKPISKCLERCDITYIQNSLGVPNQVKFQFNLPSSAYETNRVHFVCSSSEHTLSSMPKQQKYINPTNQDDVSSGDKLRLGLTKLKQIEIELEISKLIEELSLENYYPSRITLSDIREIKSPFKTVTEKTLPWLLLTKIIMLNYNSREEDLNVLFEKNRENEQNVFPDDDDNVFEDTSISSINPADLLYVTFLCCDQMLKQEIISKLFCCRLAVPFIYRDSSFQLVFSQWALRKVLLDKSTDQKSEQIDALHHETKIISFIRIGRNTLSKSKIINDVLYDRYHPTFFHKDCPFGATARRTASGMVEASWFVPSGRENDIFNDLIMFLNLRGDSVNHETELEILCKLSHVIVVHGEINQLKNTLVKVGLISSLNDDLSTAKEKVLPLQGQTWSDYCDAFKQVHKSKFGQERESLKSRMYLKRQEQVHGYDLQVIYALESSRPGSMPHPNQIWKEYKITMAAFQNQIHFLNLKTFDRTRSSADITKGMRKLFIELIRDVNPIKLIQLSNSLGISDEINIRCCAESKKMVVGLISSLNDDLSTAKEKVLPLQGQTWSDYCDAFKQVHKSKFGQERESLKSRMYLKRQEQVYLLAHTCHPFITMFINYLSRGMETNQDEIIFFIEWLKIYLDEHSRTILPALVNQYRKTWVAMKSAVEDNSLNIECRKKEVDLAEQRLVEASFGLEHVIREMGQMYEAVTATGSYIDPIIRKFPLIVSNLIQNGYPFEIMDGDTAMVPFEWVQAVLDQVIHDVGDQQILTISVLGIQSSGKSTLLNAMFGLQFAVSAGRCTRGVYAQLVKVEENILPYKYVLVIDTEGLRAPELADTKHSHDNELATLVLGLGNITVINIKGENTAEMENVLQIAVHAFLRLRLANGNLKLQQTCIFVHQNVPAIDASSKMTHSRHKMMDKLDKLTADAANHEGISNIKTFNQVIEVNPEIHMWYFSDLWYGDPPMAPVNLGYSRDVNEVKQHILFDFAPKGNTFFTISETTLRLQDLWIGIMSDNFVYSFRNSLEVKAYHEMDKQFHKSVWNLEKNMQIFIQQTANTQIIQCRTENDLEQVVIQLEGHLQTSMLEKLSSESASFITFIDNCSLSQIMEQWKQQRSIQLKELASELIRNGRNTILMIKMHHTAGLVSTQKLYHEIELQRKAEALAQKCRGESLSTDELLKIFNITWATWVSPFENETDLPNKSIAMEVKDVLLQLFNADGPLIAQELKKPEKALYKRLRKLKNSIPFKFLNENHVSISSDLSLRDKIFCPKIEINKCKKQAFHLMNTIFAKIDAYLTNLLSEDIVFEKAYATTVFMKLKDSIDEHNAGIGNLTNYTITAALRVKMAVHIAMHSTNVFLKMDKRYKDKHNVISQMNEYKTSILKFFRNEFENKNVELKLTNLLLSSIENILEKEIDRLLPLEVVQTIIDESFSTKYSLILAIMKDLAEKENIEDFKLYILDGKTFALEWITNFTNKAIFHDYTNKCNKYLRIVDKLVNRYIEIIQRNAKFATANSKTKHQTQHWVHYFEKYLSKDISVPFEAFDFCKTFKFVDCLNVQNHLIDQLNDLRKNLEERYLKKSEGGVKWAGINPYSVILDKLWGCTAKCPFCGETCQKTSENHPQELHTCIQHRPLGIRGTRVEKTNVMVLEPCSYKVHSNDTFYCSVVDRKCQKNGSCKGVGSKGATHSYKQYRSFFKDWDIEPSAMMNTSNYWMWFICRFRKELVTIYGYEIPDKILMYNVISKQEAIESLTRRGETML